MDSSSQSSSSSGAVQRPAITNAAGSAKRRAYFERLPPYTQGKAVEEILEGYRNAPIVMPKTRCRVCGVSRRTHTLKTCSGCGYMRIARVLYCSKRCQSLDWRYHKSTCGADHQGPPDWNLPHDRSADGRRRIERSMWGRIELLRRTFEWASIRVYYDSLIEGESRNNITFYLSCDDDESNLDPSLRLDKIRRRYVPPPVDDGRPVLTYRVVLTSKDCPPRIMTGDIQRKVDDALARQEQRDLHMQLWPWVLGQIIRMSPPSTKVATDLLTFILSVVNDYVKEYPFTPVFLGFHKPEELEFWTMHRMDDWHAIMEDVLPQRPWDP